VTVSGSLHVLAEAVDGASARAVQTEAAVRMARCVMQCNLRMMGCDGAEARATGKQMRNILGKCNQRACPFLSALLP
jgi:hypothetical protein